MQIPKNLLATQIVFGAIQGYISFLIQYAFLSSLHGAVFLVFSMIAVSYFLKEYFKIQQNLYEVVSDIGWINFSAGFLVWMLFFNLNRPLV